MEAIVQNLRKSFNTNKTKSASWRRDQLNAIMRLLEENHKDLCDALQQDLNKNDQETVVMEFGIIKNSIVHTLNNLEKWMKPQKTTPMIQVRGLYSTYIQHEPFGVVLVIGAWNYPYQLLLTPLVGAVASGNCALCKPSELAPKSAALLEKLWPKYFDPNFIALVNGGVPETTDLLKQRFDYIFYTGNTTVAKIIMTAAAQNLTPVTLECGGKSPCYVDETADLEVTARRICWGKFANAGQTCVAPDYILCTKEIQEKILPFLNKSLHEFYGQDPQHSDSFGRIINDRHFKRVLNLLDASKVVLGGVTDEKSRYISPTIMFNVKPTDKVMQEEIFGPILPFITVSGYNEAIEYINQNEKPLAMYVFTKNKHVFREFKERTSSGSFALNEVLMQISLECLPFGGVGHSGVGRYHGKYSFETFSHSRSVLESPFFGDVLSSFRYPPYNKSKINKAIWASSEFRENIVSNAFAALTNPYILMSLIVAIAIFFKNYIF